MNSLQVFGLGILHDSKPLYPIWSSEDSANGKKMKSVPAKYSVSQELATLVIKSHVT